jgi:hypothetical protein
MYTLGASDLALEDESPSDHLILAKAGPMCKSRDVMSSWLALDILAGLEPSCRLEIIGMKVNKESDDGNRYNGSIH